MVLTKRNWLLIGGLFIFIVGVIAIGIFMTERPSPATERPSGEKPKEEIPKESVSPKIEEVSPISEIDATDWKTYKNEVLRFEIKYPDKWRVKDKVFEELVQGQISFVKGFTSDVGLSIGVNIYTERGFGFEFLSQGKEIVVEGMKVYPTIFKIGNENLIYLDMCFYGDQENMGYCPQGMGNFYYQFSFYCGEKGSKEEIEKDECNRLFNQIVQTFRFIEKKEK